jgi:hypothetical protein
MGFVKNLFQELPNNGDFLYRRRFKPIERQQSRAVEEAIARIKGDMRSRMLQVKTRKEVRDAEDKLAHEELVTSQLERFFARNIAALIGLFTKLDEADFPGLYDFIQIFYSRLGYNQEDIAKNANLVRHVTEQDVALDDIVDFINREFNPNDKDDIIELLYVISLLKSAISEREEAFIQVLSDLLNIDNLTRLEIRSNAISMLETQLPVDDSANKEISADSQSSNC